MSVVMLRRALQKGRGEQKITILKIRGPCSYVTGRQQVYFCKEPSDLLTSNKVTKGTLVSKQSNVRRVKPRNKSCTNRTVIGGRERKKCERGGELV